MIAPHVVERNNMYDDLDCLEIQKKFVSCHGVHHALLHIETTLHSDSDKAMMLHMVMCEATTVGSAKIVVVHRLFNGRCVFYRYLKLTHEFSKNANLWPNLWSMYRLLPLSVIY